ncbi:MAG: chromosomal replication initiator protein DnaA [Phycisphaerales bacterium]|nr:MAG: chromosomal replication initiator protein DnaA [Phycisphaerales bacterium]
MQGTITDEGSRTAESEIAAINEALAQQIGQQKYRIWFKNSTRFTRAGEYLKIGVPNLFIARWIENHFSVEIAKATRLATGAKVEITFVVDPDLSGTVRRTQLDSQAQLVEKAQSSSLLARRSARGQYAASHGSRRSLKLNLDTFVVGSSNELAYNAARAIVREQKSPFSPLFIHGGYGLGKTHLLQGICNAVPESRPETNWLYLSAEDFVNQFVVALKTKKLEAFRRRIRRTDLLAIDDIHFLASKPSTQEEFLHTFNTINLAGKQVVLASDAHPKMIGQLSEKLVSRFVSGMVVKIEPPDFHTRCRICRQYAAAMMKTSLVPKSRRGSTTGHVPESVIRYVAENLRSSVRELEGALLKVVAYAALQNETINLAMAKAVLAEHLQRCDPIVHVSDIESTVATYFGTTPASLHSSRKNRTLALARHFSMYLTRKHTKMSSAEVGRVMGNKNHATVLAACKRIEGLIKLNSDVNWRGPTGNKIAKARTVLAHLEASL